MTDHDSWLIRGVTIAGGDAKATSILLGGGSVTAIGPELDHPGAKTLDAGGLIALPDHAIVMHPGPMNRGMEIAPEVADSARSTIVEQVANGVSVRMAVLYLMLGGHKS